MNLMQIEKIVSRETRERLEFFVERLRIWNHRINLIGDADLGDIWNRHVLDCAQLVPLAKPGSTWLDIGSGGGFPGAVVAIILAENKGGHVHLVESNRKKAAFLLHTLSELQAPATVHARRVEQVYETLRDIDIVTARAVAPLPILLEIASPWLCGEAHSLFQKGRDYRAELEQCRVAWAFELVEHPSCVQSRGAILEISALRRLKQTHG